MQHNIRVLILYVNFAWRISRFKKFNKKS